MPDNHAYGPIKPAPTAAEVLARLKLTWNNRADTQGYKPGTVKHERACLEFFIGATTALAEVGGPDITLSVTLLAIRGSKGFLS